MALIKCSECGKEISQNAKICPNCGNPIKKTKKDEKENKVALVFGGVVLIFIGIFTMFNGTNKMLNTNTNNSDNKVIYNKSDDTYTVELYNYYKEN